MQPLEIVVGFVLTAGAIVGAGIALARGGDVIAARTRLGGLWIGSIFLAMATSLPELATDVSAIRLGVPDLAVGDLFGSSMANMLILGMASLLPGSELFRKTALDNALLIAFAILLTAMAAVAVLMEPRFTLLGVDPAPVTIAVVYLGGTRLLLRHTTLMREAGTETETVPGSAAAAGDHDDGGWSLRKGLLAFGGGAVLVLLAGPLFARYAAGLARLTGLEASFVGTWLVGFSTSLPELVTTVAAVRMGSYDLAVGNLYGSNAFNTMLLLPLDLVHGGGPLLDAVDPVHALSGLVAIALMAIGLAAVVYRAKGRLSMVEPNGLLMILTYAAGMALIFACGVRAG